MKINCIYNEDCLHGMRRIESGSIDMILCDLPQGITRNEWDKKLPMDDLWEQYCRVIKDNGAIVLFSNGMYTAELMMSNPKMWRYNLVWEKTQPTGFLNSRRMPLRAHEDICVFYKKLPTYNPQKTTGHERKVSTAKHKRNGHKTENYGGFEWSGYDSTERFPRSVLQFSTDKQTCSIHPTQKPVALLEYLILTYTNEWEIVLDGCMGSGATAKACINTKRNFIGFETEKKYYIPSLKWIGQIVHAS